MPNKACAFIPPCAVGIIAPASAPRNEKSLSKGLENLRSAGFEPRFARADFPEYGYLAGNDSERLHELNQFLESDSVDALICVRGGYGSLRLLDHLDFEAARLNPKLLVGYSDITALHLALFKHAGWVGISGPMVAVDWPEPEASNCAQFLHLVSGDFTAGGLDSEGHPLSALFPGHALGTLLGGNLSLIVRLIGTPHLPDLCGAILFVEEIGETPYRIDGLLAQMQLAGILQELGGIVLGGFTDSDVESGKSSLSLEEVFSHYFEPLGIPVATGLRYGHIPKKVAVPIGIQAELIVGRDAAQLVMLESPVRSS